jgi:hypothetical protein
MKSLITLIAALTPTAILAIHFGRRCQFLECQNGELLSMLESTPVTQTQPPADDFDDDLTGG